MCLRTQKLNFPRFLRACDHLSSCYVCFPVTFGMPLVLSSSIIINSKFRNNVNAKLSKSCAIFSKISQNFFLILLIETLNLLRLPKISPKSHTNISYNILKIIQQLSQQFIEHFYKFNAKFTENFQPKFVVFSLNNLRFLSISFLDSFYKISSIPNFLFLINY